MAEYISKETAIAKLTALEVTKLNATMADAKRVLADMPSVDVAPIVEKWSKAHSRKTRQSEFLELWPNAKVFVDGVLDFCPQELDSHYPCQSTDIEMRCQSCRRKYWMQEIE